MDIIRILDCKRKPPSNFMLPVAATPPDRGSARKYKLVGKPSYIRHEIPSNERTAPNAERLTCSRLSKCVPYFYVQ